MINKYKKLIHNKFSRFFKFFFSIRYLFVIFFVAIVLFLLIPQFFDYKKKEHIIKLYLSENYGITIEKYDKIEFNSLPTPHLTFKEANLNISSSEIISKTKRLIIYPKLISLYNFENLELSKIKLHDNYVKINYKKTKILAKSLLDIKKKFDFIDLNIKIIDKKNNVIDVKKINFSNYGRKKGMIEGQVFNNKFKIKFVKDLSVFEFNLVDTGITANINLLKKNSEFPNNGKIIGKFLDSKYRLNFSYDNDSIKINNFTFREKKFSFDSKGYIDIKPFVYLNLNTEIKDINSNLFKNLDIKKIINSKSLIKKMNFQKNINFKSEKFSRDLIEDLNLKMNISYGRLNIDKLIKISENELACKGNTNLLVEYPILNFNCKFDLYNKKKILKKFKISSQKKHEPIFLKFEGQLNILNNKINFDSIKINKNIIATEEDLKFYKQNFEDILFNEDFVSMFSFLKMKKFLLKII